MLKLAYTDENIKKYPMMKGRGPWSKRKLAPKLAQLFWLFVIIGGLTGFETDLTRAYQAGDRAYWLGLTFLIVLSNILYLVASLSNPGYTEPTEWDEEDNELQRLLGNRTRRPSDAPPLELCEQCNLTQPLRSRHCFDCGRCCKKWDHHCPFVGNCVGANNHRFFVLYLIVECYLVYWGLMIMLSSFRDMEFHIDGATFSTWGARAPWVIALSLMLCSAVMLLTFHTYLMIMNRTTREVVMLTRFGTPYPEHLLAHLKTSAVHPFSEGLFRNIWSSVAARLKSEYCRCYRVDNPSLVTIGHQFVQRSVRSPHWMPPQPVQAPQSGNTVAHGHGHGHTHGHVHGHTHGQLSPPPANINSVGVDESSKIAVVVDGQSNGTTHVPAGTEFVVTQPNDQGDKMDSNGQLHAQGVDDVGCSPVDRRRR